MNKREQSHLLADVSLICFSPPPPPAPEEKEVIKGQYGKLTDAYGCLGELRLKSGEYPWLSRLANKLWAAPGVSQGGRPVRYSGLATFISEDVALGFSACSSWRVGGERGGRKLVVACLE